MTAQLTDVTILVVEDDPDSGELLQLALEGMGASVALAASGADAMRELAARPVDVVLCDLSLPDGSGLDWLAKFRSVAGRAALPAIAVSGHVQAIDRERSLAAGFEKHLNKPVRLADLVTAIATLVARARPRALQPLLGELAAATGCRFTSLLRFEGDQLVSVWTYDRDAPRTDPFPLGLPIVASYCILVKQSGGMIVIENAPLDRRADGHPKQHVLATYVAAPVFRADGAMFGTLCSYDEVARVIDAHARDAVTAAAREVERTLIAPEQRATARDPDDERRVSTS